MTVYVPSSLLISQLSVLLRKLFGEFLLPLGKLCVQYHPCPGLGYTPPLPLVIQCLLFFRSNLIGDKWYRTLCHSMDTHNIN